jgi:hypothetical protein
MSGRGDALATQNASIFLSYPLATLRSDIKETVHKEGSKGHKALRFEPLVPFKGGLGRDARQSVIPLDICD